MNLLSSSHFLGDGIFDKLSNEEVTECMWMSVRDVNKESNLEFA